MSSHLILYTLIAQYILLIGASLWQRQFSFAIYWGGYAVSTVALCWIQK